MFVRNWIQNRGASGQLFTGGDSGTLSNPAQWLIDAIGGGSTVTPEKAAKNSNVSACVSILADDRGIVAARPRANFCRSRRIDRKASVSNTERTR